MNAHSASTTASGPSRRAVATGLAWSVPAVAMVSAAPSFAVSLRKDPGINGWVLNSPTDLGRCRYDLDVNSAPSGWGDTPDGAPWGLYVYDVSEDGSYSNAKLVYWVRGTHTATQNPITWQAAAGHSSLWSGPVLGAPQVKADGFVYTPYTWTYTGIIDPANVASDGRLYLDTFHVKAANFSMSENGRCLPLDIWAYREILVDPDGPTGPQQPETLNFERRWGRSGPYPPSTQGRMAVTPDAEATAELQQGSS
ncbi:hypothetical protein SAMN05445756_0710 [Kytococcus aerolatus]|uniref:Uncharacterized protein n=1 Tax=Kytococcus aerolatus TaxID=592308 RepID=A0A212T910_9MICO|nr:hypothetical protein [Kytococcus aerolatus]SNC62508.1 hypothetical protein SAMN05445756_0710 [Kytococcus aerolatus]